jgi:hypothetical protein
MSPVDESAKVTDSGALPLVGLAEKSADGGIAPMTAPDPKIATIKNRRIERHLFMPLSRKPQHRCKGSLTFMRVPNQPFSHISTFSLVPHQNQKTIR